MHHKEILQNTPKKSITDTFVPLNFHPYDFYRLEQTLVQYFKYPKDAFYRTELTINFPKASFCLLNIKRVALKIEHQSFLPSDGRPGSALRSSGGDVWFPLLANSLFSCCRPRKHPFLKSRSSFDHFSIFLTLLEFFIWNFPKIYKKLKFSKNQQKN